MYLSVNDNADVPPLSILFPILSGLFVISHFQLHIVYPSVMTLVPPAIHS